MKHERTVTFVLIGIFIFAQVFGLFLIGKSMDEITCTYKEGSEGLISCNAQYSDTIVGERPETQGIGSLIYILIGVGVGTALLLLIAKFKKTNLWKTWFFMAVWMSSAIAIGVLLPNKLPIAWGIGLVLAAWKIFRPNIIVYNLTEILMYAGIAVLIVPLFDVKWALILLGLISIYDMIAVWKSKHMVTMAKFINKSNAFAGIVVPYNMKTNKIARMHRKKTKEKDGEKIAKLTSEGAQQAELLGSKESKDGTYKNAILGGGDITFPLLFAGTILQAEATKLVAGGMHYTQALAQAYGQSLFISLGAILAIGLLFVFAKKDKFYPAMPFVTAGCLLGWVIVLLI